MERTEYASCPFPKTTSDPFGLNRAFEEGTGEEWSRRWATDYVSLAVWSAAATLTGDNHEPNGTHSQVLGGECPQVTSAWAVAAWRDIAVSRRRTTTSEEVKLCAAGLLMSFGGCRLASSAYLSATVLRDVSSLTVRRAVSKYGCRGKPS